MTDTTQDDALVEAVARALCRTVNPWDRDGDQWEGYAEEARAAITALRQQERQNQDGASGQAVAADRSGELHRADEFQGDDSHLIDCIDAFLDLSDKQAFAPLNIGKAHHAYRLLCAARHRFAQAIEARRATPSARKTGDKDRENPVEGASTPTGPERQMAPSEKLARRMGGTFVPNNSTPGADVA